MTDAHCPLQPRLQLPEHSLRVTCTGHCALSIQMLAGAMAVDERGRLTVDLGRLAGVRTGFLMVFRLLFVVVRNAARLPIADCCDAGWVEVKSHPGFCFWKL